MTKDRCHITERPFIRHIQACANEDAGKPDAGCTQAAHTPEPLMSSIPLVRIFFSIYSLVR